jgi:predicted dienelactone hydrolase
MTDQLPNRGLSSLGLRAVVTLAGAGVLCTALLSAGGKAAQGGTAYKFADGLYQVVVVKDLQLRDQKRGKDLSVKIYHPAGRGPFPVVIFSHGFGGDKDAFEHLSRFLATHGYVCIHPTHADSLRGKGGLKEALKEGALLKALSDPKKISERVGDVSFVLDSFAELEKQVPALRGTLDTTRIGVAGHSFGAFTAMLLGGVTVDVPGGAKDTSFADKRIKAILPISGQGTGQQGLTERSWRLLRMPMMTLAGSQDLKPGKGAGWRREPFKYSPPGDKYEVFIDGANHLSYGGRLGSGRIQEIVKIASIAFWDAYLKGINEARAYLQSNKLAGYAQGAVTLSRK